MGDEEEAELEVVEEVLVLVQLRLDLDRRMGEELQLGQENRELVSELRAPLLQPRLGRLRCDSEARRLRRIPVKVAVLSSRMQPSRGSHLGLDDPTRDNRTIVLFAQSSCSYNRLVYVWKGGCHCRRGDMRS